MTMEDFLREVLAIANEKFPEHRVLLLGSTDLDNGRQAEATIMTNMEQDEVDLMFATFRRDGVELEDDVEVEHLRSH
jgi:hypothetical protein